jgi:hypothetical protein
MARITETTSKNWKVKGAGANDPQAKWKPEPGKEWKSKPDGDFNDERLKQWVAEMVDWSEMMQEAVLELRERVAPIADLQQKGAELSAAVEEIKRNLRPAPR